MLGVLGALEVGAEDERHQDHRDEEEHILRTHVESSEGDVTHPTPAIYFTGVCLTVKIAPVRAV